MAAGKRPKQNIENIKKTEDALSRKTSKSQWQKGNSREKFPVIGIGASAGGLEAFGSLFSNMPKDTGMAFILIQHIAPSHVGNLVGIIQKQTLMPVIEVKNGGIKIEPDHLYMIPQNREISVVNGTIELQEEIEPAVRHSIDVFFSSLANDLKDLAICIILSGTGTDGTAGARAIKAQTGLVIVQDPNQAGYSGMPRSAIDAGVADMVLPAEEMAEKLIEYTRGAYGKPAERRREALEKSTDSLQDIFKIIKSKTKRDFSGYKVSTVNRRIERRMSIHEIQEIGDYVRFLRESPDEVQELVKDFLIQVTSFFRDPEAFEAVKTHLKAVIKGKGNREVIRAWTVGCSTGEETYSIAILIDECLAEMDRDNDFHIFGTDMDAGGIEIARAGVYPQSIEKDVSAERLKKYFTKEEHWYRITRYLRERLVFATHDILTDAPFSHMDLVLARNLLIYLDADTQKKVIPVLHYGLNEGGIFFMGTAETIGEAHRDMFEALDQKWRIYQAKANKHAILPTRGFREYAHHSVDTGRKEQKVTLAANAEKALLKAMPPAVLVDNNLNILYVHGETGKYLQLSEGRPSNRLLDMARENLKISLATAVHLALTEDRVVTREGMRVRINGDTTRVKITVKPVSEREVRFVVLFEDTPEPRRNKKGSQDEEDKRYTVLEQELQFTRENLKNMVEELEASNEELRSTVEEHQSTNEELNSTNEELESSREELQSMNEELNIINSEHSNKIEELSRVNDDFNNLLTSTDIATIFMNDDLKIERFTPAATRVLNLREGDEGRPLTDITSRIKSKDLAQSARKVLDDLVPVEMEALGNDGRWFFVRILPYRTSENAIQGVVISFVDISPQKQLQKELNRTLEYARSILDTMREPMVVMDGEFKIESVNQAFYRTFGTDKNQTEGKVIYELGNGQWDIPALRRLLGEILPKNASFEDFRVEHDFPGIGRRQIILNARRLKQDNREKILLAMEDVTDHEQRK